ncbi:hypothetical protein niasHS_017580 [Heterodera schachtii]|uniref:Eukaryotic translation initiation factor 3 subunit D n=2 Tax=Heterodera TaxID=34509 RepID=A0ABD2I031_HETSC
MSLPQFDLPECVSNSNGWGPGSVSDSQVLSEFVGLPYQHFNKCDRIGRIVDWLGVDRFFKKGETRDRYNERVYGSSATAGVQFDYIHDNEESNFQLVDSSRPQKPQRPFRRQIPFRKLAQREQERREYEKYNVSTKMKRSILKEQQKAYKVFLRRGGGTRGTAQRPTGRRFNDRQAGKGRQPSVQVRPDWAVLKELDFVQLNKLYLPNIEPGKDIPGETYGTLHFYDKALMDKLSVKNPLHLEKFHASFYSLTTTEDPVFRKLSCNNVGNVFATDIILATIMAANRSVNSWDIIAYRIGDKLFFDKRSTSGVSPIDAFWVSETAPDPPSGDAQGINNANDLASEALYVNQNFRRQVLKRDGKVFKFEEERIPFEDEQLGRTDCAYKYRTWNLGTMANGTAITLVARTEHDAVMLAGTSAKEVQKLTVKAFNEWDSSLSGGVDWRSKLDIQKGAVLATEMRNNSFKLAKWTLQAILAGSDYIKLGYVSRVNSRNSTQHVILGTQQFRPNESASNMNLNLDTCWGILRAIIDFFMEKPPGKYLMMKDPLQHVIRIYSLPEKTFDSSESESDQNSEGDGEERD